MVILTAAGGSAWNLRLAEYASADFVGRLQLLLEDSHVNSVSEDQQRLKVVLARLSASEQEAAVLKLLAKQANGRLAWCCQLFRVESSQLQVREMPEYMINGPSPRRKTCLVAVELLSPVQFTVAWRLITGLKISLRTTWHAKIPCGVLLTCMISHQQRMNSFDLMQVFPSVLVLGKAALTCLYSHKGVSSWETMHQVAHYALAALRSVHQQSQESMASADLLIDQLLEVAT